MNQTRLWAAATIIALVVLIGFVLSVPHTRDVPHLASNTETPSIPLVTLHDVFRKGVHTITGSLEAPNACTMVSAESLLQDNASSTGRILVQISMPPDAGVCLQVPTRATFQTTIAAPVHLPIEATVNGSVASTSVL
ncbi:hypothetical protein KGQ72_00295 [Patescibacteria group bacterium]|nr:hypothetical protein [Patescibacteria group bacterium]